MTLIDADSNGNGTFDVRHTCAGGCGRRIERSNITGPTLEAAVAESSRRLNAVDGWVAGECRQCRIHSAGWQSDRAGVR